MYQHLVLIGGSTEATASEAGPETFGNWCSQTAKAKLDRNQNRSQSIAHVVLVRTTGCQATTASVVYTPCSRLDPLGP